MKRIDSSNLCCRAGQILAHSSLHIGKQRTDAFETNNTPLNYCMSCLNWNPDTAVSVDTGKYSRRRLEVKLLAVQTGTMAAELVNNHGTSEWKQFIENEVKNQQLGEPADVDINSANDWLSNRFAQNRKLGKFLREADGKDSR